MTDVHFFQHEDPSRFNGKFFQPAADVLPGINAFLQVRANEHFHFRLNLHAGRKSILLSCKSQVPGVGIYHYRHMLAAVDLGVVTLYKIAGNEKYSVSPVVGFFMAFNQYMYLEFSDVGSGTNTSLLDDDGLDLDVEGYPFTMYAGINLGINYSTRLFKHPVEFYTLLYYSPSDLFNSDFTYQTSEVGKELKGKYQFISLGMNCILGKSKI